MATVQNTPYPPYPYYPQQKKRRWWIPLLIIGIILLFILLVFLAIFGAVGSAFKKEIPVVKANTVLYLNLGKAIYEAPSTMPSFLGDERKSSFFDIILAIRDAKNDPRIEGIYYKASGASIGWAKTKELLEALDDFKKSGKFIYAYIETGAEGDYLKALPADKIIMPKEGMLEMNGFGITGVFFKGLLDKIGVDFYVQQFEDFKSAGESYSRRKFSDSAKKATRVILDQRYSAFLDYVAKYRKMERKDIENVLNNGLYTADTLLALKFLDGLMYESELKNMMKAKVFGKEISDTSDEKLRLISVDNYVMSKHEGKTGNIDTKNSIAIIYASGTIVTQSVDNLLSNERKIVASKYVNYLKEAREDKKVKAIILRIDSPGGSVIASDDIWNEIVKTRKVKPVYASMSDVAASGGYYIAMACDTIVAQPLTITGSIGVISMIPSFSGLLGKLDITLDTMSTGPSAQDLNLMYPISEKQRQKMAAMMSLTYKRFVQKVADSRKKSYDEARSLAKGRVWTGEDALNHGLVDLIGGLQTTIDLAKSRIGVPKNTRISIREFPQKEDEFAFIRKILNLGDEEENIGIKAVADLFRSKSASEQIYASLPPALQQHLFYFKTLSSISESEPILMALPYKMD